MQPIPGQSTLYLRSGPSFTCRWSLTTRLLDAGRRLHRRRPPLRIIGQNSLLLIPSPVIPVPICSIAIRAHSRPKRLVAAPGSPAPSGTLADWEVIISEGKDCREDADQESKENVEAVVSEVEPPGRGDEDGRKEREEGENEEVQRRGGSLAADGRDGLLVRGDALVGFGVGGDVFVAAASGLEAGGEGGEGGGFEGVAGWCDEGDCNRELAREEEREVEKACRS
jgi:hypothetical protein